MAAESYRPGSVIIEKLTLTFTKKAPDPELAAAIQAAQNENITNAALGVLGGVLLNTLSGKSFEQVIAGIAAAPVAGILDSGNQPTNYVDLRTHFVNLNIYESIETPFIMGDIKIQDTLGLLETLPIVGGEILEIGIRVPGTGRADAIDFKKFVVHKVSDRMPMQGHKGEFYTLHFISEDVIHNINVKISKAYDKKTASDIVKNIIDDFVVTNLDVEVDSTSKEYTYVVPNFHPFKAITYIKRTRARSKDDKADFVFYLANNKKNGPKYYFKSLSELLNKSSVFTITHQIQNIRKDGELDYSTAAGNIKTYHYNDAGNVIRNTLDGTIKNKTAVIKTENDKSDTVSKLLDQDDRSAFNFNAVKQERYAIWSGKDGAENDINGDIEVDRKIYFNKLENNKLNIPEIFGDTRIQIGKVITFKKPHLTYDIEKFSHELGKFYDRFAQGDFLVIRLCHRIFINSGRSDYGYVMSIEAVKEKLDESLSSK